MLDVCQTHQILDFRKDFGVRDEEGRPQSSEEMRIDDPRLPNEKHRFTQTGGFTPYTLLKAICTRDERFFLQVTCVPNGKVREKTLHN